MNKKTAKRKVKRVKGKVGEEVGKKTGNKSTQGKGMMGQIAGRAEEIYDKAKSRVKKEINARKQSSH